MKKWVDRLIAERTVATVITVNAVALFLLEIPPRGSWWRSFFFTIDYACVVFFVLEAILKIRRVGWRGYWSGSWNRFDFAVVVISMPILVTPFLALEVFNMAPVLRAGRLFRLFRVLKFVPNFDHLVVGMQRALRASVGVFLALLLINVILAMMATELFRDHAPEHFGNPILSCYTMFKVFTVEGWYEIPDLVAENSGAPYMAVVARFYFIFAVIVGGILGLSLANAVFVDQMMMDNTEGLEDKMDAVMTELREIRAEMRKMNGDGG